MSASSPSTAANRLPWLLSLGLLLVLALGTTDSNAIAGCGFGHVSYGHDGALAEKTRPGELSLKLYVEYVNGAISFTWTPPSAPCDGLSCNSKPKMRPVGLLPWNVRFADSTSSRNLTSYCWEAERKGGEMAYPSSTYAPRGGLQPPEHPPRSVLA